MTVAENLAEIDVKIAEACAYAGLDVATPKLIAVSKRQSEEAISEALEAGHRVFGENRIQEAEGRWPSYAKKYSSVELHLIGSLQSNKVADAVALFDVIQVVDRPKLARAIARECTKQSRSPALYIQVNTGEEPQKGGVLPADLSDLVVLVRDELKLNLVGLMSIPPVEDPAAQHFAFLKALGQKNGLSRLSMGMSADYALAASMGATDIRVGTAIFGERNT